ncbi:MAG: hypothetical protein U1E52_06665 [Geminicoccaceae bacterium]
MLLPLGACVGPPPGTRRAVQGEAEAVRQRIAAAMTALGLVVTNQDGLLTGRSSQAPVEWAACGSALVGRGGGEHSTQRLVSVSTRSAEVQVTVTPTGEAAAVEVRADFSASYVNPDRGGRFERPCRSKGVLETRLLDAAA